MDAFRRLRAFVGLSFAAIVCAALWRITLGRNVCFGDCSAETSGRFGPYSRITEQTKDQPENDRYAFESFDPFLASSRSQRFSIYCSQLSPISGQ